jgi:hypothetical protein
MQTSSLMNPVHRLHATELKAWFQARTTRVEKAVGEDGGAA